MFSHPSISSNFSNITTKFRHLIQIAFTALSNGYFQGFTQGTLYQGKLKQTCLPGLNCYSCPGALGSCPLGAVQATLTGAEKSIPFYALGILIFFGTLLGRAVCGFLCPFGFIQDLLYKLRPKSLKLKLKLPKPFRHLPLLILLTFVILLPLTITDQFGISAPAFCKFICPSGTLMGGIPLLSTNDWLRSNISTLFYWKFSLLSFLLLWSLLEYRPFCKYLCPLGYFYGLFNGFSLYKMEYTEEKCISCKKCTKSCNMYLDPTQTPNHSQCVRCGDCIKSCPTQALTFSFITSTNSIDNTDCNDISPKPYHFPKNIPTKK